MLVVVWAVAVLVSGGLRERGRPVGRPHVVNT
jgi:hypothetical protein